MRPTALSGPFRFSRRVRRGIFHTIMDRFGPRLDRGNVMIAQKIAEQGGKPLDPKYLKEMAVSYMGIGGSDWATRIQCDFATQALTPKWTLIHNDYFQWSLDIIMNDEAMAQRPYRSVRIWPELRRRSRTAPSSPLMASSARTTSGPAGVCPHCHGNNFYLQEDGTAICCALRHRRA